jgi:predicted nucleic acid-binding protein
MDMNYVLDTNIIIYLLKGRLLAELPRDGCYFISVISELEVLAYPDITPAEEASAKLFLQQVTSVDLSAEIKEATIALRRQHRLKLPDAIIVATVKTLKAVLLTNDEKLNKVPGLTCQPMEIKSEG